MATVHTQLVPMRSWIHIVKSIITEPDTVTATNLVWTIFKYFSLNSE